MATTELLPEHIGRWVEEHGWCILSTHRSSLALRVEFCENKNVLRFISFRLFFQFYMTNRVL